MSIVNANMAKGKVMVDTNKLKQKIKEKGLKFGYLAQLLGISENTFTKKMKGIVDFKATELKILRDVLELSWDEVDAIFFAESFAILTKEGA